MKKYIRIGEVPESGRSSIWRGEQIVGTEAGVSCYNCCKIAGKYRVVVPLISERATQTLYGLAYSIRQGAKVYLVTGKFIGYGSDNEPILRDVKIIEDITDEMGV